MKINNYLALAIPGRFSNRFDEAFDPDIPGGGGGAQQALCLLRHHQNHFVLVARAWQENTMYLKKSNNS